METGALGGAELIERLKASGLRGRGGGWFPAWRKWQAVRAEAQDPWAGPRPGPFVVANGAEGEPGSVKDRHVMTTRPEDVASGLALAAAAVGAHEAVVYLKGSFAGPAQAMAAALQRVPLRGVRVSVKRGEEGYIAGEETAILETLEGRRAWPRPKPPLPYAAGFEGRPTLVQNVETLARVRAAIDDPEAFRAAESTLVSLWGHVRRPGVYDVPLGTPLSRLIEEHGGGAPDGIGMVFPAGPSGAPLTPAELHVPLHPDALRAAGSSLGTAAVLVIGASVCPLSVADSLAAFFERESCGQCPPCSVGSRSLHGIVRGLEVGGPRDLDLHDLDGVAGFMEMHGYCAHSRTAAASLKGLLARFSAEVAAHVRAGSCPRPSSQADPFHPGSPERAGIEAFLAREGRPDGIT